MVGGQGRNLLFLTGDNVAFTDGASTVVGGDGENTVFLGRGETLAYGGSGGGDRYVLQAGDSGGSDAIVGFRPGVDQVTLYGYSDAEVRSAVANAGHGAYGSTLSLRDGTSLTLFGVQDLGHAIT